MQLLSKISKNYLTNIYRCDILIRQPTQWGISSVGRALEWHSRGQGFDSPILHQIALYRAFFIRFCSNIKSTAIAVLVLLG